MTVQELIDKLESLQLDKNTTNIYYDCANDPDTWEDAADIKEVVVMENYVVLA